jgi:hypothetical protein
MSEQLDLIAISARAAAAAPGPWVAVAGTRRVSKENGDRVAVVLDPVDDGRADAEFIAAARTDVPAMVARVLHPEAQLAGQPASTTSAQVAHDFCDTHDAAAIVGAVAELLAVHAVTPPREDPARELAKRVDWERAAQQRPGTRDIRDRLPRDDQP